MCSLCATCHFECECPRCPHRAAKLRGWPPQIQPCGVCGLDDDRECSDPVCAITEHFMLGMSLYCQMCVESQHETAFPSQQLGMHCKAHAQEHKKRMLKRD